MKQNAESKDTRKAREREKETTYRVAKKQSHIQNVEGERANRERERERERESKMARRKQQNTWVGCLE